MTIEFHAVAGIDEQLIDMLKEQVMQLKHVEKTISRAEIMFRKRGTFLENKICELRLTMDRNSIFVLRKADTFEKAGIQVVRYLRNAVRQHRREAEKKLVAV
ncbi:MAG TPA: hypothetical protein VFZ78_12395 [Flavisolibacter sp.]